MAGAVGWGGAGTVGSVAWDVGEVVVLREVLGGRIRSARPLRVVADSPAGFAGYLTPRSTVMWPRLVGEEQSQTPDQGWRLRREEWQGPGCLFVIPAGAAYAVVRFLDRDHDRPVGWKVDFMAPPRVGAVSLDTLDWAFDLLVDADATTWTSKDEDDLAQLCRVGLLDPQDQVVLALARAEVTEALATRTGPFAAWADWRADPTWKALELPTGWDQLPPTATTEDQATASVLARGGAVVHPVTAEPGRAGPHPGVVARSGRGVRLLDAAGRVWLDADLADGTLLHGHAHPAVVEAVTRQATLALATGLLHEGQVTVAEAVVARFSPVERVLTCASGVDAWRTAVELTRRASGRSTVAAWHAPIDDGDVLLLPTDGAQAAARLAIAAGRLAAVVVDPLVLATLDEACDGSDGGPDGQSRGGPDGPSGRTRLVETLARLAVSGTRLVADERRTLGAGPAGGCARLGLAVDLVVLGESLFGGLPGGLVGGATSLLSAGDPLGTAGVAPNPLATSAALETLRQADGRTLDRTEARAQRLRQAWGAGGLGNVARLPAGASVATLRAAGVLVGVDGSVHVATVADDDDINALLMAAKDTACT